MPRSRDAVSAGVVVQRIPMKACPGRCRRLIPITAGLCGACGQARQQAQDARRGSSAGRGYDARWRRFRRAFAARVPPICGNRLGPDGQVLRVEVTGRHPGRLVPATDLDHIERVSGPGDPRFLDETAVQWLCHGCHSEKTMREGLT